MASCIIKSKKVHLLDTTCLRKEYSENVYAGNSYSCGRSSGGSGGAASGGANVGSSNDPIIGGSSQRSYIVRSYRPMRRSKRRSNKRSKNSRK